MLPHSYALILTHIDPQATLLEREAHIVTPSPTPTLATPLPDPPLLRPHRPRQVPLRDAVMTAETYARGVTRDACGRLVRLVCAGRAMGVCGQVTGNPNNPHKVLSGRLLAAAPRGQAAGGGGGSALIRVIRVLPLVHGPRRDCFHGWL